MRPRRMQPQSQQQQQHIMGAQLISGPNTHTWSNCKQVHCTFQVHNPIESTRVELNVIGEGKNNLELATQVFVFVPDGIKGAQFRLLFLI